MDQHTYIEMPGLERSEPVQETPLQLAIEPIVGDIKIFWALVWGLTLIYMAMRFVIIPFLRQLRK